MCQMYTEDHNVTIFVFSMFKQILMLLFQSFRLADINIYQGRYLMNNLTLKSFKFCNYSKGTQCHFYLKYHSIIKILYIIKHVFHLKKNQEHSSHRLQMILQLDKFGLAITAHLSASS